MNHTPLVTPTPTPMPTPQSSPTGQGATELRSHPNPGAIPHSAALACVLLAPVVSPKPHAVQGSPLSPALQDPTGQGVGTLLTTPQPGRVTQAP
jgi:hypothetical protein